MTMRICILLPVSVALLGLVPLTAAAQVVPHSDLAIVSNTANVKHGHIGDQVTFTIVATNNGPDPAANVFVTFIHLQGLSFVHEFCDLGISADTPSCEYVNVQPGQTLTTIVVAEIASAGDKVPALTACVSTPDTINDPDAGNDCATATVKIVGRR